MENIEQAAFYRIGYGLYVVTTNDGIKDNGCIVNAVTQLTSSPLRVAVCVNKQNHTHETLKKTGKCNVNCLSESAPFSLFETFGFQSGAQTDKFASVPFTRTQNGLAVLTKDVNAVLSLTVLQYTDLGTHGLFVCGVEEGRVLSNAETMTYSYYQKNVKPKPPAPKKTVWVCKICGYVYEGEELPPDFVCPLCKHGAADFEKIEVSQKSAAFSVYECQACGWTYDEERGDPARGIPAGTKFTDLPADFKCPVCGVEKSLITKK